MNAMGYFFAHILEWCYGLTHNYGWAIVLFTLLTRVIMLPISVIVQLNSIKMVRMYPEMNQIKAKFYGNKDMISEENYKLYKQEKYHPALDLLPVILQLIILMGVIEGIKRVSVPNTMFFGFDLSLIPGRTLGKYILIPVVAAFSAWLMCFFQNIANVLQSEQSKANKYITMGISVALSLYLGFLVNGGVALYWTVGNLLAIAMLYMLNACINPKKHIDYESLRSSKEELNKVIATQSAVKKKLTPEEIARDKADYKRFLKYGTKQIVFYSERNGFYKYYRGVIEYILRKTDIVIHYITSDINDEVFQMASDKFITYYISENRFIVLMMKMDSDMVVMTMPDLQKYQIKKSLIRDDTEYVYMDHGIGSDNLMLRKHALDHFDTIFTSNDNAYNEIRGQEKAYNLKPKNLIRFGSCLIDDMIRDYKPGNREPNQIPTILIGPSWQPDNIMDTCIDDLLDSLLTCELHVIVRPHPQYVRHNKTRLEDIRDKYASYANFELQTDFASNSTVFNADILITDWSSITFEYAFTTLKPVLFIDTPMKVMNPDWKEIDVTPLDLEIRTRIGLSIAPDECKQADQTVNRLLSDSRFSPDSMSLMRDRYLYNVGNSAQEGARYLINRIIEYSKAD